MSHNSLDYARRLREQGYRVTPQRQIILNAVCAGRGHTSVDEIYGRLQSLTPVINLATVYRSLDFFCRLGIVVAAEINGRTVYEIAGQTPHHHLVCRNCGAVEGLGNHHFRQLAAHLRQEHGFQAELDHMTIAGLCSNCSPSRES